MSGVSGVSAVVDRGARRLHGWVALGLACVALAYFSAFRSYGINLPDEGTLLYKFERMADGERLYADFHAGYTPGVFFVHSFLQEYLGQSILPGRMVLAVVNSLSVAMLFLLAAPVGGVAFAAVGALLYATFMPVHPGHFASFNIPYPTWYSVAIFLAGLLAARSFVERPNPRRALVVGVLAGVGFLFKPNLGAFQLACGMLLVLAAVPRRGSAAVAAWWWTVWASVLVGIVAVFGGVPGGREAGTFVLPALAAAALCARRAGGGAGSTGALATTALPTALVGAGFAAVTAAWLGYYATLVPLSQLLEEALFVGSDYAEFFYTAHPDVTVRTLALVAGFVVLHALPARIAARGYATARVAAAASAAVAVAAALVILGRPMLHGFVSSVMSEIETSWAYAAALASTWLLLGVVWLRPAASAGLLAIAVGAPLLYFGNYPRTDFMHWVWAAPVCVVAGATLLAAMAAEWSRGASVAGRAAVACALVAPLVVVGGLRVSSALTAIARLDGLGLEYRAGMQLGSHRAPLWINIGRAESVRDLEVVVDVLRELTEPGERVFTFPVLDIVSFLADRGSPLRDSYFFPRWIGHDDEARAVGILRDDPPRYAVVLHDHWTFFEDAPVYYTRLAALFASGYRLHMRIGRYAILVRQDVISPQLGGGEIARGQPDPRLARYLDESLRTARTEDLPARLAELRHDAVEGYYPRLTTLLEDDAPEVRAAAVSALRHSGDDRVAAALFRAAVVPGGLPERERMLALRLAGAWAGAETAALMKDHLEDPDPAIAAAALAGSSRYAANAIREAAWFGGR